MKLVYITLTVIAVAAGILTYVFLNTEKVIEKIVESPDEAETMNNDNDEIAEDVEVIVGNIPSSEEVAEEFADDMPENKVKKAMHHMSHQKITADRKWGKIFITEGRIKRLIDVVEANEYENKTIYLSILERWESGDFSRADEDHNTIWKLQGGTIGRATGLMTEEEENRYIKEHFE
ncbi:DUF6241 domain-containing protein [Salipaludibacillus sp. CF4.18]|uniref:DUF6241 domain-containing protein n=1 Tax=Salipaludibacillus sp. CF4.18 TaxID=3373081 RepID=UPI003EE607BB